MLPSHSRLNVGADVASSKVAPTTDTAGRSERRFNPSGLLWLLPLLGFAYLWFRLIDTLHIEWTTNPQYGYGWIVPFLCLGLILRRWAGLGAAAPVEGRSTAREPKSRSGVSWRGWLLFGGLAFLYLPTRLVEAATPEWRPVPWVLGMIAIGLTLLAIRWGGGRRTLRELAFPILFFAVAIPWPTPIEAPIIQGLTRISAVVVIELLAWLGVPAMAHGNIIQIATGVVGIDEACSGIRSFQSSIMISLFLGEFYRLRLPGRLVLFLSGFALSLAFNIVRMGWLTWVAAKEGVTAIDKYHDPAGITIALSCTVALLILAYLLDLRQRKRNKRKSAETVRSSVPEPAGQKSGDRSRKRISSGLATAGWVLVIWLITVEAGVAYWYHQLESNQPPAPAWTVEFPTEDPTFQDLPMADATRDLLRFDEGRQGAWTTADGLQWQVFYFDWQAGRVSGYLAKRHTPEICLTATGSQLESGPVLTMMNVNGIDLPIRSYVFKGGGQRLNVYHCRWEAGAGSEAYVTHESGRFNLIRGVWNGRGNKGQKVLEVVILGEHDPQLLEAALKRELENLVRVDDPVTKS